MKVVVGVTGASGAIYAKRLIEYLKKYKVDVCGIFTENAQQVWQWELEENLPNIKLYGNDDFMTPPASGSSDIDAMVICPCSMGSLGKIANGITDNLLTRAADVILKEKKKLILVPREMPYNLIHIENLKKISLAGGTIIAASPSFYSKPRQINELVDTVIDKILRQLELPGLVKW